MAWTTISNALVAVGAKPFATTIQALRDNPVAIADGDSGAPRIQDAALDTGAATTAGTTWVRLRMAGAGGATVGTYAMLSDQTSTGSGSRTIGDTLAGSNLITASAGGTTGAVPAGTWRCMGFSEWAIPGTIALTSPRRVTLWLRIS